MESSNINKALELAESISRQSMELRQMLGGGDVLLAERIAMPSAEWSNMWNHRVGFLKVPKDLLKLPTFSLQKGHRLVSPSTINLSDWDLEPKDQKETPRCAAFAAASYAENILWRKRSYPARVSPDWIYEAAKKSDGMPDEEGTTLTAVLQALIDRGMFDAQYCQVKVLRTIDQVRFAIHKYGTCLIGVIATKEYYECNRNKHSVCGEGDQSICGGHALQVVGILPSGVIARNSWGGAYGYNGNIIITWEMLKQQFVYGATLDNPLYDFHISI